MKRTLLTTELTTKCIWGSLVEAGGVLVHITP